MTPHPSGTLFAIYGTDGAMKPHTIAKHEASAWAKATNQGVWQCVERNEYVEIKKRQGWTCRPVVVVEAETLSDLDRACRLGDRRRLHAAVSDFLEALAPPQPEQDGEG